MNGNNVDIGDINNKKPTVFYLRYLFGGRLLLLLFVSLFFDFFVGVVFANKKKERKDFFSFSCEKKM